MQTAAFRTVGLEWSYEILEVMPERLPEAVGSLRGPDHMGANVTIPHKISVMPLLDALEGEAEEAGAVNTMRGLPRSR